MCLTCRSFAANLSSVLTRFGKRLIVVALAFSLGWQWAALQTVAWAGMLVQNLRCDSLAQAWSRTFDGNHPCCLCKAIAAGKKSEKKSVAVPVPKFEFPPLAASFALIVPPVFRPLSTDIPFPAARTPEPPTPPPRRYSA